MRRTGRDQVRRRERHRGQAEGKQSNEETRRSSEEEAGQNMEGARRPEAAEAAKQQRTGKEPAGSGEGQGGKPTRLGKDH